VSKTDERIKACGCPNADLQVVGYMLDIGGGEGIVGQMKPPSTTGSQNIANSSPQMRGIF
jgi:hypothetical protein